MIFGILELVIIWVIMGIVVSIVADSKGRDSAVWLVYAILIWPVALAHILVSVPSDRKPCPHCAELTKRQAKVCPHCGSELPLDFGIDKCLQTENERMRLYNKNTQGFDLEQIVELKEKNLNQYDSKSIKDFCERYGYKEDDIKSAIAYFYHNGWPRIYMPKAPQSDT